MKAYREFAVCQETDDHTGLPLYVVHVNGRREMSFPTSEAAETYLEAREDGYSAHAAYRVAESNLCYA